MSARRTGWTVRSRRFLVAWLGLHALLLQLLLPVFHHPEHVFTARGDLATALLAFADAGAMPAMHHSDGSDHKQAPPCPLCLSVQHAQSFLPPAAPPLLVPQQPGERLAVIAVSASPRWTNLAARARAPPLAA